MPFQTQPELEARIERLPWTALVASLDARGYATTRPLLAPAECEALRALYDSPDRFRSRVVMERHGFGLGEYRYFAYPLPPAVEALRRLLYPRLAPVARSWAPALGLAIPFPDDLDAFLAFCRARGQSKPTPLLLRYDPEGFNCLHQDVYGEVVFPLQVTVLLSRRGVEFGGGEFLLVEQRPRAQSRGEVVELDQGEAVIFATRGRPAAGRRGTYRVTLRHGVSRVTWGRRFSLGVIFHDAA